MRDPLRGRCNCALAALLRSKRWGPYGSEREQSRQPGQVSPCQARTMRWSSALSPVIDVSAELARHAAVTLVVARARKRGRNWAGRPGRRELCRRSSLRRPARLARRLTHRTVPSPPSPLLAPDCTRGPERPPSGQRPTPTPYSLALSPPFSSLSFSTSFATMSSSSLPKVLVVGQCLIRRP